ncbi:MAG TPA: hypothetical protein H9870_08760 [Candidatus Corynebacterium avicola]|uniref:Uncharacterized protein n=1 Tax=Candidatus Corynebacterium avicola TaxID=2838527 RepID=A0A9D1RS60_9CORY|nr:hypothetical protein [Candidatus Corynebacterium avicola]
MSSTAGGDASGTKRFRRRTIAWGSIVMVGTGLALGACSTGSDDVAAADGTATSTTAVIEELLDDLFDTDSASETG